MTNTSPPPASSPNAGRRAPIALLPAVLSIVVACMLGGVLGQIGNVIYSVLGEVGICVTLPGLALLFVITGAISFFANRLFTRMLTRSRA